MSAPLSSADGSAFNVYDPACPARAVLDHVSSRWGVLALGALQEHTYRFSDLRRRVNGVSEKVLAQTLRTLERDGLVVRVAFPQVPPRVEYSLTEMGVEAAELVSALVDWIQDQMPEVIHAQQSMDGRR